MTYPPTGLNNLMNELVTVEQSFITATNPQLTAAQAITGYRWRPPAPDPPAIYNWLSPDGKAEKKSITRHRDTFVILTRVAIRHTDVDEEMALLEQIADGFLAVIDKALWRNQPLNGAATWAERTGMRTVLDPFNQIDFLCIEFPLELRLDREIPANQP